MKILTMEQVVCEHLRRTLELCHWNKSQAAQALDLDRRTVYRMIGRYRLEPAPELEPDPSVVLECTGEAWK